MDFLNLRTLVTDALYSALFFHYYVFLLLKAFGLGFSELKSSTDSMICYILLF
jgi:hypothetical protein